MKISIEKVFHLGLGLIHVWGNWVNNRHLRVKNHKTQNIMTLQTLLSAFFFETQSLTAPFSPDIIMKSWCPDSSTTMRWTPSNTPRKGGLQNMLMNARPPFTREKVYAQKLSLTKDVRSTVLRHIMRV